MADEASQFPPCWIFQVLLCLSDGLHLNPELPLVILVPFTTTDPWRAGTPLCTSTFLLHSCKSLVTLTSISFRISLLK